MLIAIAVDRVDSHSVGTKTLASLRVNCANPLTRTTSCESDMSLGMAALLLPDLRILLFHLSVSASCAAVSRADRARSPSP